MAIPRIARADLTAAALAKLHWRDAEAHEHRGGVDPGQIAHVLTMLGYSHEHGTIFTMECRADRRDSERYCGLFEACRHPTSDNDLEAHDHGDTMPCPDGGQHRMFRDVDYGSPGWHKDTRLCRFVDYCEFDEQIDNLDLKRGIYFVAVSYEDWQAGVVDLEVLATVGEPVDLGDVGINVAVRVDTAERLRFGLESDVRDILEAELLDDAVDYDPEDGTITINVDPAVRELVRYLDVEAANGLGPASTRQPHQRPIVTVNTGGRL
jgi:hypothetical protein